MSALYIFILYFNYLLIWFISFVDKRTGGVFAGLLADISLLQRFGNCGPHAGIPPPRGGGPPFLFISVKACVWCERFYFLDFFIR